MGGSLFTIKSLGKYQIFYWVHEAKTCAFKMVLKARSVSNIILELYYNKMPFICNICLGLFQLCSRKTCPKFKKKDI